MWSQLCLAILLFVQTNSLTAPELQIESPAEYSTLRDRFQSLDKDQLAAVARLVGLSNPSAPIHVRLAPESSEPARSTAPWIAGFARGYDEVMIFPSRTPSYPHDSLVDVLRHEVAHVLIARAANGGVVPRWFNEGLAMSAERSWKFRDQTELLYRLVTGPQESLAGLDRLFDGGQAEQGRAYLLSGALMRELMMKYGEDAPSRILSRMADGADFRSAFLSVTGRTPGEAEVDFWNQQRAWTNWLALLFSQEVLWGAITLLAILAIIRRRRRNAQIEKRWAEEDEEA